MIVSVLCVAIVWSNSLYCNDMSMVVEDICSYKAAQKRCRLMCKNRQFLQLQCGVKLTNLVKKTLKSTGGENLKGFGRTQSHTHKSSHKAESMNLTETVKSIKGAKFSILLWKTVGVFGYNHLQESCYLCRTLFQSVLLDFKGLYTGRCTF